MDATASGVGTTSPMTAGSASDTMIQLTGVGKTYPDYWDMLAGLGVKTMPVA